MIKTRIFEEPIILFHHIFTKSDESSDRLPLKTSKDFSDEFRSLTKQWQKNLAKETILSFEGLTFNEILESMLEEYNRWANILVEKEKLKGEKIVKLPFIPISSYALGNIFTPIDILCYEVISIQIDLDCLLTESTFKYFERVKVSRPLKNFIVNEDHFRKPWTASLEGKLIQTEKKLQKEIRNLTNLRLVLGNFESFDNVEFFMIKTNLIPRNILKSDYELLKRVNSLWNKLYDKMARNFEWCADIGKGFFENDPFCARILDIAKKAQNSKFRNKISGCMPRNDFLYNSATNQFLQIEINVLFGSCAYEADVVPKYQKFISEFYLNKDDVIFDETESISGQAEFTALAHDAYGNKSSYVLFVVDEYGTRMTALTSILVILFKKYKIKTILMTLNDMKDKITLDDENGTLYYEDKEIGVVNYQGGLDPPSYVDEKCWKARETIELSRAIKLGDIGYAIVELKPFQAYISKEENLKKFLTDPGEIELIQRFTAKLWDFKTEEDVKNLKKMVEANSSEYVLKMPREGGGNCIFYDEITKKLENSNLEELKPLILMQKIEMSPHPAFLFKDRKIEIEQTVGEIGLFSYFLSDENGILFEKNLGHFVKTKSITQNEGGLDKGGAVDAFSLI